MAFLILLQILALIAGAYTQSYSQVRYASTRRNSTAYDPYSILSNPALANHRLPVYPQQPDTTTAPKLVLTSQIPLAEDVQSAVHDAIHQGGFNHMPFLGVNHLVHSDTVPIQDLDQAPSQHHQILLPPETTTPSNTPSQHEEGSIRDYYQDTDIVMPPSSSPKPETTTDCLACRLFHEALVKDQQHFKIMTHKGTSAPQNIVQQPATKRTTISTTSTTTKKPEEKTNFTAPAIHEVFSISDARIHTQKPVFQGESDLIMPPHFLGQAPFINSPQSIPAAFAQQQVISNGLPNVPPHLPPGAIIMKPQDLQSPLFNRNTFPQSPQGVIWMDPNRNTPSGIQSHTQNIPLSPQSFPIKSTMGQSNIPNPGLSLGHNPNLQGTPVNPVQPSFNAPTPPNGFSVEANRRVTVLNGEQSSFVMQQQPQQSQGSQGTIRGPMGIHIPIPPKSVPAHTVMGPPVGLSVSNSNGAPPKRNGGIMDSIRNFFSGSMFGNNRNRARFLEEDGLLLTDDDNSTSFENITLSENITADVLSTEIANDTGSRSRRDAELEATKNKTQEIENRITFDNKNGSEKHETKTNGSKTLLDEIGDYVRKTVHRWREDTQRLGTPLWPTIRDTVRNYFSSSRFESLTKLPPNDGERRGANQGKSFWSMVLDEGFKKNKVQSERRNLEDNIHNFFQMEEHNDESLRQLEIAAVTSLMPRCALDIQNKNYCLQDTEYPTDLLKEAIRQDSTINCNVTLGRYLIHRLSSAKVGACKSPIHKVRPLRAKNQDGIWKLIVNVDTCQQTVHVQKCHPLCASRNSNVVSRGHCKEVHAPYTLFAFDSKLGFHQDQFQFPSACWCGS